MSEEKERDRMSDSESDKESVSIQQDAATDRLRRKRPDMGAISPGEDSPRTLSRPFVPQDTRPPVQKHYWTKDEVLSCIIVR